MVLDIRAMTWADVGDCGQICYQAIATRHHFPPDFASATASATAGEELVSAVRAHPRIAGFVAESDGRVVGGNFLDERSLISSVGPLTVAPGVQDRDGRKTYAPRGLASAVTQWPTVYGSSTR